MGKGLPAYPYGAYGLGYAGLYNGAWAGYNGAYAGYAGYGYAGYPYAGAYGYPYAPALVAHPNGAVAPAAPVAPYYAPGFAGLVAPPNGALVPAEPADVVEARAEHLAAHA